MPLLDKKILLRVTAGERERIQADAKRRRLSVNDYLRSVMLGLPDELELRVQALEERIRKLEGE